MSLCAGPFPSACCAVRLTHSEVCPSASSPGLVVVGCHHTHDREQPLSPDCPPAQARGLAAHGPVVLPREGACEQRQLGYPP